MLQKTDIICIKPMKFLFDNDPDILLHNHYNCLVKILQFDLCLVSGIFSFFPVLCPILLAMGVDLLQFLSVWFNKATNEESFSLTKFKTPSFQVSTGLITNTVVSQR